MDILIYYYIEYNLIMKLEWTETLIFVLIINENWIYSLKGE